MNAGMPQKILYKKLFLRALVGYFKKSKIVKVWQMSILLKDIKDPPLLKMHTIGTDRVSLWVSIIP